MEFNKRIEPYLMKYDETLLVFNAYLENSVKNCIRMKRAQATPTIEYKITDSINIAKVNMKSLLSYSKTKDLLTAYITNRTLLPAQAIQRRVFAS